MRAVVDVGSRLTVVPKGELVWAAWSRGVRAAAVGENEGMREETAERQRAQLDRRRYLVNLPMVPLRHHSYLQPLDDDPYWHREPRAVGIGPDGDALALWDHRAGMPRLLTRHDGTRGSLRGRPLPGARPADFIQPLPDGDALLVEARSRNGGSRGGETAEVRNAEGAWLRSAHLGDAVGHVLTTVAGDVWVGYFDEAAASGRGLGGHGLVRFDGDLRPRWLYPLNTDLPRIDDCLALNIADETAFAFVYNSHHVVSVLGQQVTDHGGAPQTGADALLIEGDRGALIGGYGADYDLITPLHLDADRPRVANPQARLVLPDGMELRHARMTSRGADLHVVIGGLWYRASLDDIVLGE